MSETPEGVGDDANADVADTATPSVMGDTERAPTPNEPTAAASAPPEEANVAREPAPVAEIDTTLVSAKDEPPPLPLEIVHEKLGGPGVSTVRPARAGALGGTLVTVFGGGFEHGCTVRVDGAPLMAEWVDAFSIRFEAPPHPVGKAQIEVENPDGQRSNTALELEYVAGPAIASVVPHSVPLDGGVEVTIEGTGFDEGCTVNLFGVHAPQVLRVSDTVLKFKAPPSGGGPVEGTLTLTNPDGIGTRYENALYYTNLDPRIDRLEPATGWITGGKAVNVHGKDFHAACVFKVGEAIAETRFQHEGLAEIVIPAATATGPVPVTILNPDGTSATLADAFTYEAIPTPPKLISIAPAHGPTIGGVSIRISGDNFTDAMKVRIAEVSAVTKFVSAKIVDVELPARSTPGVVAVELALGGVTIRQEDAFTYFSLQAPKISGIEPMSGPSTGGTKVVIEGEGFPKNATVRFGREAAKYVAVKSATRIETVTPPTTIIAHADVEVSSPETGPGVMKKGFRYDAVPAPTITMVAPAKGSTEGGTELTVEGKNFAEGVAVFFGKVPAMKTRRISGSMIEVKTPGGPDGQLVDVVVKNPDGKEATQRRAFQWDARYRS
ncbi:MAG: IPT/TIG domain-containing protein [Polyangiaceae bacterium]